MNKRCFYLTVRLLAEGGGNILVQGLMLMLCRSTLLSFSARLFILVRKMIFPFNKEASTADPVLEHLWSDKCNSFFIWMEVICSNRSAFMLPTSQ